MTVNISDTDRTMPPRRVAPSLQLLSVREFGSLMIRILVQREMDIVDTNRSFGHLMHVHLNNEVNGVPSNKYTESIAKIEAEYAQLVTYLEDKVPGAHIDMILRATIDVYAEKFNKLDEGDDLFVTFISCNLPF